VEHWWSDTDRENVLLATCNFILRTHLYKWTVRTTCQVSASDRCLSHVPVSSHYALGGLDHSSDVCGQLLGMQQCEVKPRRVVGICQ